MAIQLSKEVQDRATASIQRYFDENMDDDIGDLRAMLLLEFFLEEIGPSVYNQAIADAEGFMRDRLGDLDGACYVREFGYWKDTNRAQS